MTCLLEEERKFPFRPTINDCPGSTASIQILHPEISASEFKQHVSRQREVLLAERQEAQVCEKV